MYWEEIILISISFILYGCKEKTEPPEDKTEPPEDKTKRYLIINTIKPDVEYDTIMSGYLNSKSLPSISDDIDNDEDDDCGDDGEDDYGLVGEFGTPQSEQFSKYDDEKYQVPYYYGMSSLDIDVEKIDNDSLTYRVIIYDYDDFGKNVS